MTFTARLLRGTWGNLTQKEVHQRILLAEELISAIKERNVCVKFGKTGYKLLQQERG